MVSLTLRNKLMIGFGRIIALVIILLLFMFYILNVNMRNAEEMLEDRYVKIYALNNIRYEINNISRNLLYIAIKDGMEVYWEIDQIAEAELSIARDMGSLQNSLTDPEVISLFAALNYNYQAYDNLAKRIIQTDRERPKSEVENLVLSQEAVSLRTNLDQSLIDLRTKQEQLMEEALQRSQESYKLFTYLAAAFSICFLLASILISFWVMRSIIGSIRRISSVITSASNRQEELFC